MRFLAKQVFDQFLHLGHAGHAADEHHFINFCGLETGVLDGLFTRALGAHDQIIDQAFELGAGQLHGQMLRT